MHPIFLSLPFIQIHMMSVALVVAWVVFSFIFWKNLRANGVDDDKIFDMTFYATIVGLVFARGVYVFLHWELFAETWLKILALWVEPGFSLYGGMIGTLLTFIVMTRRHRVRLGHVLDALALSFPAAIFIALIGVFLEGSAPGKTTMVPWALPVIGFVGKRHPVQLYECIALNIIIAFLLHLQKVSVQKKWPYGILGVWFFLLFSPVMFALEFLKDTRVYLHTLSANQWILIAFFAEALGAFYVRGGGREVLRPVINKLYAKFSKRST